MNIKQEINLRLNNLKHTIHALKEEASDGITAEQLENALKSGFEVIEEYTDDPRGISCMVLCSIAGKPVHVVCAPHEDALIIITVYIPDASKWTDNYKKRK
ncbi:MAG: DUF4258 domain-containing protein [Candidatus Methanoperedens sp.]|jgi:hypothetical protein|nr:DUF4258 domain-containing protein [Candidatus Methanoperedens sp.]PKL52698.1 MAG: hypothetical protein CVV36_11085 [Candidatus Methanoperedenaceae archaeon HGW-Methanoperedenaceae-1]